ncbi:PREDICTED: non-specific lipid transfer protein GPI-anchored 2-like isoform X2 [Brassica oleracea var. oleracea]|uniref:non-specific lipid transfer protein GPI-anchored 2-like isoform X2 n=1 Tax=Brassica oleracea var. oleracea TaxID=109376 RepID=UPI0006A6BD1A|nr:PREDICTED: non-specific lipid transfer protein GPI-anchored 2-like isoform X2 [Brassica oleracea var. oleracea]
MDPKSFLISSLIFCLLSNSPILMSLAQINTPCSPTMLSSVTGCMSFLTGGASSPTSDCCEALISLTGTGMDCLCLIVTANVPLDLPVNRTLAISLPRACGVPVQCKGPASHGPTTSPPTETQYPEGPASFGPVTSPTSSMDPDGMPDNADFSGPRNGGDPREPPKTSASSPSSSLSLKLSPLLFALFAFEFISFF